MNAMQEVGADDAADGARTALRGYQIRRLVAGCGVLVAWVGCYVLAGNFVVGTLLLAVVASTVTVVVLWLVRNGRWSATARTMHARPWRDSDEILDVAAHALPDVVRTTLTGERHAPSTVVVTLDPRALVRLSASIGLAHAEEELATRYRAVLQALGTPVPPVVRIVVHGSPAHVAGQVTVAGRLEPSAPRGRPVDPTLLLAADPRRVPAGAGDTDATRSFDVPITEVPTEAPTDVGPAHAAGLVLEFEGGSVAFDPGTAVVTIGRSRLCDVALPNAPVQVSRRHAVIERDDVGGWWLHGFGVNGTSVGCRPVTGPTRLVDGDTIIFGAHAWTAGVRLTG